MKEILTFALLMIAGIIFVIKTYKKCEDFGEKIFFGAYILIAGLPIVVLYLDMFNIPSILKLTMGLDTRFWLDSIFQYITNIISMLVSALISVGLVMYELNRNNMDSEKRDKENLRIQNVPILKFNISSYGDVVPDIKNLIITKGSEKSGTATYNLILKLKNIGMNGIKTIKIKLKSDIFESETEEIFGYDSVEMIEKGEEITISKFFALKCKEKDYKLKMTVYYEDFLSNWYKQKVYIEYKTTMRRKQGSYEAEIDWKVEKEKLMEDEEIKELTK